MNTRSLFSEFSESLRSGFFADNVVLTLARAKKRGELTIADRQILNTVVEFFQNVLDGFRWSENPKLTMHSAESAYAFSKAARVFPEPGSSNVFQSLIEGLLADAEKVIASERVEQSDVDNLIEFFTTYGREELNRADELINPRGGHGARSWTTKV